ncbi:MAG: bifunctional [glutamate--ammonia ligase]-adenylyl-L-tyrosine phosphorylase/[glutamate--ammonia-ligase] adenylyltransferase [Mariprofundaceae bacterium]|nr:bifunctional [glutamate--ammonia ligase]-adenylyl-L-tyrosine phosphorylase/[glutamate--ammonia-ligase] adenylyltransferase [Mariprofundaceae bacterium]
MNALNLNHIPQRLQEDAQRLCNISPLFTALMRTASDDEYQTIFQGKEHAVLPCQSDTWMPILDSDDLAQCMAHLRQLKQHAMRYIIWWELGIHGDIEDSYHAITAVAEGLLQQAVSMAERCIAPRFGYLKHASFCVIGLGKLGGNELNLGSDVDPLFVWQGSGNSEGGRKSIPAKEYYNHLSRMFIKLMAEQTQDGVVWPVDLRLRPGGDGAAICLNLDATLSHYLEYGQTWERAMLIKARPVAGDMTLGKAFLEGIAPFVYRRYLDYTCVAALADMKQRINHQTGHQLMTEGFDVKRGMGGIRDIEFIIQSMQLLHAGLDISLRVQEGKTALNLLQKKRFMQKGDAKRLFKAYCFWRKIEHALQARKGEQTHILPADYEDYLSKALGMEHIGQEMREQSTYVSEIFSERVLPVSNHERTHQDWLTDSKLENICTLSEEEKQHIQFSLRQIDKQLSRGLLPERSREQVEIILNTAMPHWLNDINGVQAIAAFSDLLHAIAGRATWIDLLATHQGALQWLIGVLSASRYLSEHIVKNPSWLEWPLANERGEAEIHHLCKHLDALQGDEEEGEWLATLGHLLDQARVQCALSIDAHEADPMEIGMRLADVADRAVQICLRASLHQLKLPMDFPLVALALGKHGSREMGLASDLDMVFVLAEDPDIYINGRSAREWSQRLGRRMIRQLTGIPPYGAGYEFDARLRPSGNSGVLVTTLEGFRDYQLNQAQTWEHQALCRARAVTGTKPMQSKVMSVIQEVMKLPRDVQSLAHDVRSMRQKMLNHLSSKNSTMINLKHDKGGLVDIEFLAQYARLLFGSNANATVMILQSLPCDAPHVWRKEADRLADIYLQYRQMENILRVELWASIGSLPMNQHATEWETMRRHTRITTPNILLENMQYVHDCFKKLLFAG